MPERNAGAIHPEENLWGYGKRLRFVDAAIMRTFPDREPSELTVLDVGCGSGSQLAIPLAASGYQVTAVDPHEASIRLGQKLSSEVRFHHGVVTDLPHGKFDCVIISEVLEHLEEPEALLKLAIPFLAASGVLIVTVPNGYGEFELDRWLYRAMNVDKLVDFLRAGSRNDENAGSLDESPHMQRFTLSDLRELFARNGLLPVEVSATSVASGPFVAHLFGRSKTFVRLNAMVADYLPLSLVAAWMFALKLAG